MSTPDRAAERRAEIVAVLEDCFGELMRADPAAFAVKFRKMAASPFAFYRGSACLFYADLARRDDPFLDERTSRVWIQGDLHAENFGTYMNSEGLVVFDVNDFDEAYVGPFTWDLRRLTASLALIGYEKALSDSEIEQMVRSYVRGYVEQVGRFAASPNEATFALTTATAHGPVLEVLQAARLNTRIALLESNTVIEEHDRRFADGSEHVRRLDPGEREEVLAAYQDYLDTIPPARRPTVVERRIKDVVARRGVGIGSAGHPSYNLLVEGPTQALENDVVLFIKHAGPAAPSRAVHDADVRGYFQHDGHRTVISQRALQAHSDPWLGWCVLHGAGQLVAEVSPYAADLDWNELNRLDDILDVLVHLGQATAKIHCVSDSESDQTLVPFSTEEAIDAVLRNRHAAFADALVDWAHEYGCRVRDDHRLFVDAFRNREIALDSPG